MRSTAADLRIQAVQEGGFTLIELIVVIVIIGILTAVAVASYFSFGDRASRTAAQANVRTAIPALTAFHTEHSTFVGATLTVLRDDYDIGIDDSAATNYKVSGQNASSFCFQDHVGDWYAWTTGPNEPIEAGKTSHC